MILTVRHSTRYAFDIPRRALTQSLRLTPQPAHSQVIHSWSITCDGAHFGTAFHDGAGDELQTLTVLGPVDSVAIEVAGTVETTDTLGVLRGRREKCSPLAYLRDTRLTAANRAIAEFAADTLDGVGDDALGRAHALTAAVTAAVAYTPGVTEASTTAAEVLAGGQGVCQDHSHLLIAAALSQEIPARYVAGYLLTDHEMGQAGHAWAELFVPGLGWVGFDPANACCPDERYIRLGSGLDAVGAAPIRGLTEGTGDERLEVSVAVTQTQQQQQ